MIVGKLDGRVECVEVFFSESATDDETVGLVELNSDGGVVGVQESVSEAGRERLKEGNVIGETDCLINVGITEVSDDGE